MRSGFAHPLRRKQFIYRGFLHNCYAENLQNIVEWLRQLMTVFELCYKHVHQHGNPELCLDRIGAGAEKRLDVQVLLDPFEE